MPTRVANPVVGTVPLHSLYFTTRIEAGAPRLILVTRCVSNHSSLTPTESVSVQYRLKCISVVCSALFH